MRYINRGVKIVQIKIQKQLIYAVSHSFIIKLYQLEVRAIKLVS